MPCDAEVNGFLQFSEVSKARWKLTAQDVMDVYVRIRFCKRLPGTNDASGGIHQGAVHVKEAVRDIGDRGGVKSEKLHRICLNSRCLHEDMVDRELVCRSSSSNDADRRTGR